MAAKLADPQRGQQLIATLEVVRELAKGWRRAEDLAAETGVHRRTAYRILMALRSAGLEPSRDRRGKEIYWTLPAARVRRWLGV